jgi:arginine/lysine/ornithine decarboxylase
MPELDPGLGLVGGLAPKALEQAFEKYPDAKAVFTVSPTYHGVMSDTGALAGIAHRRGAVLISDEAHGNHMYFSKRLPKGALELGADIVCQSTHKMSGALTQASMLHLGRDAEKRVDFDRVRANLSMIQTTSPSYILLASLDLARSYIATQGEAALSGIIDAIDKAREEIRAMKGIAMLGRETAGRTGISDYEPTRLVVSALLSGLDGYSLFSLLRERYAIECEFADPNWCVCVAGLGTTQGHTEALVNALSEISAENNKNIVSPPLPLPSVPPLRMTPREAWFAQKETIPFENAPGRVSAEMVVPYPPGIPVLCPGEVVTSEVYEFLDHQRKAGRHMHCAAGDSLENLNVVK